MRILLVEDEPKLARFVRKGLVEQSFQVDVATDGLAGHELARSNPYDVLVIDVNLPKLNGIELIRRLRAESNNTPVLVLTALDRTDDKVSGFEAGADDYLVKPFVFRELLARLRSLHRRGTNSGSSNPLIRVGDLELDVTHKTVSRAGMPISLTSREFQMLQYLMEHTGQVVSKFDIAEHVLNQKAESSTNAVEVYINLLRRKIDKTFPSPLIHTVVGMGYVLRT
ncbi:response regulator transcription factor [Rudanella lutea]|uniref:response regulator transcription factor n=1 Tax=Rudanella lutea TaxID=451374 RepID=UPI00035F8CCC|nr:response regulator transcription factor [Rudanella lutea]